MREFFFFFLITGNEFLDQKQPKFLSFIGLCIEIFILKETWNNFYNFKDPDMPHSKIQYWVFKKPIQRSNNHICIIVTGDTGWYKPIYTIILFYWLE